MSGVPMAACRLGAKRPLAFCYFLCAKSKVVDFVLPMHFLEGESRKIVKPPFSPDWAQFETHGFSRTSISSLALLLQFRTFQFLDFQRFLCYIK